MMKINTKRASLSLAVFLLGGCAQIGNFSDTVWGQTKRISHVAGSQLSGLLRPAPKQGYQFEHAVPANSDFVADFMRQYSVPMVDSQRPAQYAMIRTIEEGVQVYRPGGQRTHVIPMPRHQSNPPPAPVITPTTLSPGPALRPAYSAYADTAYLNENVAATPSDTELAGAPPSPDPEPDLSYVKIGGGSDMADWQTCQDSAGAYVVATLTGYTIDPAFDRCMRSKNYLPESEAIKILEMQTKS